MRYRTIPIIAARFYEMPREAGEPELSGRPERLDVLVEQLEVLAHAEFGVAVPRSAWLREFRLSDDEALLRLAPLAGVCGPEFAQAAFDLLRRRLPDTDIYVHAAPSH